MQTSQTKPVVGAPTPWGPAETVRKIAPGIIIVSTASHGGAWLDEDRNLSVPSAWRQYAARWSHGSGDQWYEEDGAILAVILTFPEYFPGEDLQKMRTMLNSHLTRTT